jgi:G:T-mismatch repair DNA endonuclease (very short patch repair protein)
MVVYQCQNCNTNVEYKPSRIPKSGIFCKKTQCRLIRKQNMYKLIFTNEMKQKLKISNKRSWTFERRFLQSQKSKGVLNPMYGKKRPLYVIEAMRNGLIGKTSAFKGRCHTEQTKRILSCKAKNNWKTNVYTNDSIKKWFESNNKDMTTPEFVIGSILYSNFNNFVFVGNGQFFIKRFCPDFVDFENKKIIEIYGKYWHSLSSKIEKDKRRIKEYQKAGYTLLIIFDVDLKYSTTFDQTLIKLQNFVQNE